MADEHITCPATPPDTPQTVKAPTKVAIGEEADVQDEEDFAGFESSDTEDDRGVASSPCALKGDSTALDAELVDGEDGAYVCSESEEESDDANDSFESHAKELAGEVEELHRERSTTSASVNQAGRDADSDRDATTIDEAGWDADSEDDAANPMPQNTHVNQSDDMDPPRKFVRNVLPSFDRPDPSTLTQSSIAGFRRPIPKRPQQVRPPEDSTVVQDDPRFGLPMTQIMVDRLLLHGLEQSEFLDDEQYMHMLNGTSIYPYWPDLYGSESRIALNPLPQYQRTSAQRTTPSHKKVRKEQKRVGKLRKQERAERDLEYARLLELGHA